MPARWRKSNPGLSSRVAHHLDFPDYARSVRNAIDRMRLRQASRLFAERDRELTRDDLTTLTASDIRNSRVFGADSASNTS